MCWPVCPRPGCPASGLPQHSLQPKPKLEPCCKRPGLLGTTLDWLASWPHGLCAERPGLQSGASLLQGRGCSCHRGVTTRRSRETAVQLVPTTVCRAELTPGPFVLDSREAKACFLPSASENPLPSPPRGNFFEPGDLLALPKLVPITHPHCQKEAREGLPRLARWRARVFFTCMDGCFDVSTHSLMP